MLSIDGSVIDPSELIRKVSAMLDTLSPDGQLEERHDPPVRNANSGVSVSAEQLGRLSELHARLSPPDVSAATRFRTVRKVIRKAIAWFSEPRFQVLEAMEGINGELLRGFESSIRELSSKVSGIERQLTSLRRQVTVSVPRSSNIVNEYEAFVARVENLIGVDDAHLETRLQSLPMLNNLLTEVESLREFAQQIATELNHELVLKPEINYLSFENEFRGSEEDIKTDQFAYLQYVPGTDDQRPVLDIGCGRGEMLQLLDSAGHSVSGIDLSGDMINLCRSKGLNAHLANALTYLQSMPDNTYKAMFCSQVVEHLSTSELELLVSLAHDKLGEDGVVIFETINPRSLYALGNHFYADLTHVRPVHPETLRFLCESVGFATARMIEKSPHEMLRSEEDLGDDLVTKTLGRLVRDFYGYQDFAVVATK